MLIIDVCGWEEHYKKIDDVSLMAAIVILSMSLEFLKGSQNEINAS